MSTTVRRIGPDIVVTTTHTPTDPSTVSVPVAELQAMRATVRELVELVDALLPGPGSSLHVRSVQGLARSVQTRLEALK